MYVPTFLLAFGQGIVLPTMPLYAKTFAGSLSLVSVAVGALALGTLLADVPAGSLVERFGRRPMMLSGAILVAIGAVGLAIAQTFPELVLYRLVGGAGAAAFGISRMAFLTDVVSIENRGRTLATFGGLQRVGTFVGPVTGGTVAELFSLRAPFVLSAVLAVAALVAAFLFAPESRRPGTSGARKRWGILAGVLRSHWKDIGGASAAQIFAASIRSGRQLIIPLYGAEVIGLDVGEIGTIVTISAIIDVSLFFPAGLLMDRLGRKYASIPSFIVMGAGMATLPLAHSFTGLLIATAIIGVGNGIGSGTMMTLGADLAPKEAAGEFLGFWRLVGDAGQMGGPAVVGTLAEGFGLEAAALVLAGCGALASLTIFLAVQETLHRPDAQAPAT